MRSVLTMRERWMRTKRFGSEPRFHAVHRLAEQMRFLAEVQAHVVAGRLDPVELVGAQEEHAAAGLDDQAIELRRFGLDVVDQRQQAAAEIAGAAPLEMGARVLSVCAKRSRPNGFSR